MNGESGAQRVVVTGGVQGIGHAIARALVKGGADIAIVDLGEERTRDARDALAAEASSVSVGYAVCDVRDRAQVVEAYEQLAESWGEADGLVNNAGIVDNTPALEISPEKWHEVMDVNLSGVFFCSQVFGGPMVAAGRGSVVNIASMSGLIVNRPQPQSSYNVSKAGVIMLTKSLAAEWAPSGVRVNAVAPGYIRTAMTAAMIDTEQAREHWIGATPLGRAGSPEEIADAVCYLLGPSASYVTGSTLVVDGGYTVW